MPENIQNQRKLRLAVLLSGGGRTMVNIADHIKEGKLNAEIVTVISSRQEVAGVQRSTELGLIPQIIRKKDTPDTLAARVFEQECKAYPQAIKLFAQGKLVMVEGKVVIKN